MPNAVTGLKADGSKVKPLGGWASGCLSSGGVWKRKGVGDGLRVEVEAEGGKIDGREIKAEAEGS